MQDIYIEIGETSSGSLLPDDIIAGIWDLVLPETQAEYEYVSTLEDEELMMYVLDDIIEYMNVIAPPGAYFGAHPGDGASFGFWLDDAEEEYIDEYEY